MGGLGYVVFGCVCWNISKLKSFRGDLGQLVVWKLLYGSQEWLRELGLFGLENRRLNIDIKIVFIYLEICYRMREQMCYYKKEYLKKCVNQVL